MSVFPNILLNAVWHTTTPDRYESIIESGEILPNPNISESERWGGIMSESSYPFVRSMGGVSLFDFRNFDVTQYCTDYPPSRWQAFVPCGKFADEAVWIKINLSLINNNFIDVNTLLAKWRDSNELHRNFMPMIEAAHIGSISTDAFAEVLLYSDGEFNSRELLC